MPVCARKTGHGNVTVAPFTEFREIILILIQRPIGIYIKIGSVIDKVAVGYAEVEIGRAHV